MIRSRRIGDLIPYATDPASIGVNALYNYLLPPLPTGCYGGGASADVAACTAAGNAAAAAYNVSNPGALQDYADATTNPLGLLNPFTGSGPLAPATSGIPTWVWLLGAGVAGLVLLKR